MRAIVFDLDDTLYPEHEFVLSGLRSINIPGFYEVAKVMYESGVKGTVFNSTLDELGVVYDEDDIKRLVETYRNHIPEIQLYEDARWALSHFQHYKVGIITDGYAQTQRNKVKALQLGIEYIIYTDDYGRENWKPSPLPYQMIVEKLSATPKDCLYVGDNITKDFITANKLGWTTIQVIRPNGVYAKVEKGSEYHAQLKIDSLFELEVVVAWENGQL